MVVFKYSDLTNYNLQVYVIVKVWSRFKTVKIPRNNSSWFIIECSSIAGTYENGGIFIGVKNNVLWGHFIKENRPNFTGMISNYCRGRLNFSDQYYGSFNYNEEEYKIVWGNNQTEEVWNKGNNFFQSDIYSNKICSIL